MNETLQECANCKATLHVATTPNGTPYWASNSGSARCFWPHPTWHKCDKEPIKEV